MRDDAEDRDWIAVEGVDVFIEIVLGGGGIDLLTVGEGEESASESSRNALFTNGIETGDILEDAILLCS